MPRSLIPLINVSVHQSMPISCSFYYYSSVLGVVMPLEVVIVRIVLAILGFLFFPHEIEYSFKVCKELCGNFDGTALNLWTAFGRMATLTMLI